MSALQQFATSLPTTTVPGRRGKATWESVLGIVGDTAEGAWSRQTGDRELDPLFASLLGHQTFAQRAKQVRVLLDTMESIDSRSSTWNSVPVGLPTEITEFQPTFATDIPEAWLRADVECKAFWDKHRLAIITALFYASLPACYAAANGAEVLADTGAMVNRGDLLRRVPRTGEFVSTVMRHRLFDDHGQLVRHSDAGRAIRYVRILHAAVRHMITDPTRRTPWDTARRGVPINQMDLAGTVLAFGLVVDEPFDRMHGRVTPIGDDENLFLSRWSSIGALLGTHSTLLPDDIVEGRSLFDALKIEWTEVAEDAAGPRLLEALLGYLTDWIGQANTPMSVGLLRQISPPMVPRLLHAPVSTDNSPAMAATAILAILQQLANSSDLTEAIGDVTFEAGFKAAKLKALLEPFQQAHTGLLDGLHVDHVFRHIAKFFLGMRS